MIIDLSTRQKTSAPQPEVANFTTAGSVTIENKVATFADKTAYIIPNTTIDGSQPWEYQIKFELGTIFRSRPRCVIGATELYNGLILQFGIDSTIKVSLSSNGESKDILTDATSINYGIYDVEKPVLLKFGWNGTQYYSTMSQEGAEERTYTYDSTTAAVLDKQVLGGDPSQSNPRYWPGKIYLDEDTYFKQNGEVIWTAYSEPPPEPSETANFTIHGGAVVENKVATFSSKDDYLLTNIQYTEGASWEFQVKCMIGPEATPPDQCIFGPSEGTAGAPMIKVTPASKYQFYLSSDGTNWDITAPAATTYGSTTPNELVYLRMSFNGTNIYQVDVSSDGSSWTTLFAKQVSSIMKMIAPPVFGNNLSAAIDKHFRGKIYLDQDTYFSQSGHYWTPYTSNS